MISFHTPLSPDRRKMMIADSSRKRKWSELEEQEQVEEEKSTANEFIEKKRGSSTPFTELLHLETRSPVDWQRCLDIQSGEDVHFYDARTNKRTCKKDSDKDLTGRRTVSLNLELNLQPYDEYLSSPREGETASSTKRRLIIKEEEEEEEEEMVATVCMRCHMLVMLCVSRPSCPNCKFIHPKPDQILFKQPPPKCSSSTSTAQQLLC